MRDTRACTQITKVFGGLVPDFKGSDAIQVEVREFISTEVLKASVTSLNDPYFVEMQRDFASLIANILLCYATLTHTPRQILLSLPGMTEEQIDRAIRHMQRSHDSRRVGRAAVLQMLEAYRGMTIDQQGKLPRQDHNKIKSEMQAKYTAAHVNIKEEKEPSPDLTGMAEMLG